MHILKENRILTFLSEIALTSFARRLKANLRPGPGLVIGVGTQSEGRRERGLKTVTRGVGRWD